MYVQYVDVLVICTCVYSLHLYQIKQQYTMHRYKKGSEQELAITKKV